MSMGHILYRVGRLKEWDRLLMGPLGMGLSTVD